MGCTQSIATLNNTNQDNQKLTKRNPEEIFNWNRNTTLKLNHRKLNIENEQRQEMIVSAYLRSNYINHIPYDIAALCVSFYNGIISVSIQTEKIFSKCKEYGDEIIIAQFLITQFIKCELYLEYEYDVHNDKDEFILYVEYVQDRYDSFKSDIYYEIGCDEFKIPSSWAQNHIILSSKASQKKFHFLRQKKNYYDLKEFESLTFKFYTDLVYLKYNEEEKQDFCRWSKEIKVEWMIEPEIFGEIKKGKIKHFYSDTFGLNDDDNTMNMKQYGFFLELDVNTFYTIILRCLCRPMNVGGCFGDIFIHCTGYHGKTVWTRMKDVQIDKIQVLRDLRDMDDFHVKLMITIKDVYDNKEKLVPKSKWKEHGII